VRDAFPPAGLRLVLVITAGMLSAAAFLFARQAMDRGVLFASLRWTAATGLVALVAALALAALTASWTAGWERLAGWFEVGMRRLGRLGPLNLVLFLLPVAVYSTLVLGPAGMTRSAYEQPLSPARDLNAARAHDQQGQADNEYNSKTFHFEHSTPGHDSSLTANSFNPHPAPSWVQP